MTEIPMYDVTDAEAEAIRKHLVSTYKILYRLHEEQDADPDNEALADNDKKGPEFKHWHIAALYASIMDVMVKRLTNANKYSVPPVYASITNSISGGKDSNTIFIYNGTCSAASLDRRKPLPTPEAFETALAAFDLDAHVNNFKNKQFFANVRRDIVEPFAYGPLWTERMEKDPSAQRHEGKGGIA